MATYFPISNNQRDSTTMLHLSDATYSETPVLPSNMMMYMNFSSSSSFYSDALLGSSDPNTTQQQQILLNFGGSSRDVEHQLSAWGHTPNLKAQGLSLSLGTQVVPSVMQMSNIQYQNDNPNFSSNFGVNTSISGEDNTCQTKQMRDDDYMVSRSNLGAMKGDISSYGVASVGRTAPNPKYLKAAQELLDEVVSVKKAMKGQNSKKELTKDSKEVNGESRDRATDPSSVTPKESKSSVNELSAAEKQELQNKMTKLLSMLDEIDRRYRQYYHQMQIVVSSFDVVAGSGAAKPYTALALQTISRHFRCLRDAINGQIHSARKSLGGEDDSANDKGVGISRLRYVDQQLRQQRALQQLGMMQNHAWRPQRGLPETSVSILRAWLFEHFLHPYPKDSDKTLLARQTGLTRSQVSNWFINARVRLWKPMVEEMYKEEAGDADMDSNSSSETTPQATKTSKRNSEDRTADLQQSVTACGQLFDSKSNHETEMIGPDTKSTFQNNPQANYGMGKMREGQNSSFTDAVPQSNRFIAGHAEYQMSEMERFGNNAGGVSLTLGLQQCEGGTLAMSDGTVHAFVPMRDADIYNATAGSAMGTGSEEYDCMDLENRPHRLFSSLLRSFT